MARTTTNGVNPFDMGHACGGEEGGTFEKNGYHGVIDNGALRL